MVKSGKNIVVGCMNRKLYAYTTKGKKLWRLEMPNDILSMADIDLKEKQGLILELASAAKLIALTGTIKKK